MEIACELFVHTNEVKFPTFKYTRTSTVKKGEKSEEISNLFGQECGTITLNLGTNTWYFDRLLCKFELDENKVIFRAANKNQTDMVFVNPTEKFLDIVKKFL